MTSCISRKRITYLQEDLATKDSIVGLQIQQQPYRVQINDVLSFRVKAEDQRLVETYNPTPSESNSIGEGFYYDGFAIDSRGNIRLPKLGEVHVLGRTAEEIRELIESKIIEKSKLKAEAGLFVQVKLAGIRYTLAGEINNPGIKIELVEQLSVIDAVANAGGIPITGDLSDIVIIRKYPGGQKVHHVDLTTLDAFKSPYFYVQPNDLILVNPLPQKTAGIGTNGLDTFRTVLTVVTALTTTVLLFIGIVNN